MTASDDDLHPKKIIAGRKWSECGAQKSVYGQLKVVVGDGAGVCAFLRLPDLETILVVAVHMYGGGGVRM